MADVLLTLIIPVRHAGPELERFLSSLATQQLTVSTECIFVVIGDGSQQGRIASSVGAHGIRAEVLRSSGGCISAARREALAQASGEWVTFPNARDALAPGYVGALLAAIDAHGPVADCFVMPSAPLTKPPGPTQDHRVTPVTVDASVAAIPSDVTRMAFRNRPVREGGIALGSYADTLLIVDLLHETGRPDAVHVVEGARYLRRPMRGVDPQTEHVRKSSDRYLGLVTAVAERLDDRGDTWVHRLLVRELFRLIEFENTTTKRATVLDGAAGDAFRERLRSLLSSFDRRLFTHTGDPNGFDERRDTLMGLAGRVGVAEVAHILKVDERSGLVELRHTRWSSVADEQFGTGGSRRAPVHGKHRTVDAFGASAFEQRIAWVKADGLKGYRVDGANVDVRFADGTRLPAVGGGAAIAKAFARAERRAVRERRRSRDAATRITRAQRFLRRSRETWLSRAAAVRVLARTPGIASRYRDAWLLMDRADMGRDNAEHMYRWLLEHHPEINAWFVLRSDSPDFARLKSEGFRLVEYGSLRHQLLLNHTEQYLSSHVGIDVSRPIFDRYLLRNAPWTFTFLQHGVIHNDLSIWLNRQKMRLFVASTHQEFEGLAGDGSPYVFTDREVRLTGLPRFDKLRKIADAAPVDRRRTIVIAPTWRNGLFQPPDRAGELRKPKPGFRESPFIQSVLSVLNDERLQALAEQGYAVKFVPHPNLAAHFPYADVPSFVSVTTYDSTDVQELIGTAAVFLTDYSSVAFDAAFAGAAVVYMQLDEGAIYGTDHTLLPGYFDFERDGFGPVCKTIDAALQAVTDAAGRGAPSQYQDRARGTFAHWDSNACERVYDAVVGLDGDRDDAREPVRVRETV